MSCFRWKSQTLHSGKWHLTCKKCTSEVPECRVTKLGVKSVKHGEINVLVSVCIDKSVIFQRSGEVTHCDCSFVTLFLLTLDLTFKVEWLRSRKRLCCAKAIKPQRLLHSSVKKVWSPSDRIIIEEENKCSGFQFILYSRSLCFLTCLMFPCLVQSHSPFLVPQCLVLCSWILSFLSLFSVSSFRSS